MTVHPRSDRHALAVFIVSTFTFSWALWAPMAINALLHAHIPTLPGQFFLASFGPLAGAIAASYFQGGSAGLSRWFKHTFNWNFSKEIAFVTLAMLVAYVLCAAVTILLTTHSLESLKQLGMTRKLPGLPPIAVLVIWMVTFGVGEESGWRAWLYTGLSQRYRPVKAAIIVAVVWMAWHLPAFFFNENYVQMGWGIIGWAISLLYGSILLAWLFEKSKSIVPLLIWHGAFDLITASDAIPDAVPMVISMLVIFQGIYLARQPKWS